MKHSQVERGRGALSHATRRGEKLSDLQLPPAPARIAEMPAPANGRDERLELIFVSTARVFGVSRAEMLYGSTGAARRGRQVASLLAYAWCEISFTDIAEFQACDRSTVSFTVSRLRDELLTPSRILPLTIEAIVAELGG